MGRNATMPANRHLCCTFTLDGTAASSTAPIAAADINSDDFEALNTGLLAITAAAPVTAYFSKAGAILYC
jgi:hypothetical protein